MTSRTLLCVLGASALISSAVPTWAQGMRQCGARDAVVQRLSERYGETRRSMGLGANNQVVEVFASDETGSWTITVTSPTGTMCLVASGQHFEAVEDLTPASGTAL